MKAVILAGGKGTRLLPITESIPKPLIEINGTPFLQLVLEELLHAGITKIGIVGCYKINVLKAFIAKQYPKLLKEKRITIIDQKSPKGTGHALLSAQKFCKNDEFIVLGGDNLFSRKDIAKISENKYAIASIMVTEWSKYGILKNNNGILEGIIEKPDEFIGNLANAGLYKLGKEIWPLLEKVKPSKRNEIELTDAVNNLAASEKIKIYTLFEWADLGCVQDIEIISNKLKNKANPNSINTYDNNYFW